MRFALAILFLLAFNHASAHQFQTLAVNLEELPDDRLSVRVKSSVDSSGRNASVVPVLEPACTALGEAGQARLDALVLSSWTLHCEAGLEGRVLNIRGLGPKSPDAIVTVRYLDGSSRTEVLDRQTPYIVLGKVSEGAGLQSMAAYLPIGIMHILGGPDHLLFVLCLMLVVSCMQLGWARLLATITAFTVAHSLTLALSVLYGLTLPSSAVEAVIALSILLLAVELARRYRWPEEAPGLSLRYPALVAFLFGLLHGFGFAGALSDIGLPAQAAGWALLMFNLGVEAGQLLFVATMAMLYWLFSRPIRPAAATALPGLVTAVGAVSAFWFIDRLLPVFLL